MSHIVHLLIPKEYRVWCRPTKVPGDFKITTKPSAADCAVCLTAYRRATTGRIGAYRVWCTNRETDFTS